jgi:YtkA-like
MRVPVGRNGQKVCPLFRAWRGIFAVVCVSVALFTACSKPGEAQDAVRIDHEISPLPAHTGPTTITLKLTDAAARPVTGAHIAIEADMTHAGMAPRFGEAREVGPGRYQSPLTLQMAGDWVILLHVTLANGQKLERQFDVSNVQPN